MVVCNYGLFSTSLKFLWHVLGGDSSPILQVGQVQIFPTKKCNESYSQGVDGFSTRWPNGITEDTFLCAGTEAGGVDACQVSHGLGYFILIVDHG